MPIGDSWPSQVNTWLGNARLRLWRPALEALADTGNLDATQSESTADRPGAAVNDLVPGWCGHPPFARSAAQPFVLKQPPCQTLGGLRSGRAWA